MRPVTQNSHWPQNALRHETTWSPGFTIVTSLPTARTTPAASCPGTSGSACG